LLKIIISGGGTGGHVFPAIAIANALKARFAGRNDRSGAGIEREDSPPHRGGAEGGALDILFVGAKNRMEMEKVPAAGFKIEGLWISGLQRRLTLKNLMFPLKLISSWMKAKKILRQFKPNIVVGVGGYASGPMLYAAAKKGIPTLIQEQNSYPGITNKLLAKMVDKICVAYEGMEQFFPKEKIILTGNPVRQDIIDLQGKREKGLQFFGLSGDKKVLLVIGGSGGARTINESMIDNLRVFDENRIQFIWQTGGVYYEQVKQAIKEYEDQTGFKVVDFIDKMDYAYAAADVVVSRAGAIAVSELCSVGKPAVLIPSPNVAEDHQTKNAMALVNRNAAILVKDSEAKEKLAPVVIELMSDDSKRMSLSKNIANMAYNDSADVIANEIMALVHR